MSDAYFGPCQTSMMERFCEKSSIINALQCPKYASKCTDIIVIIVTLMVILFVLTVCYNYHKLLYSCCFNFS